MSLKSDNFLLLLQLGLLLEFSHPKVLPDDLYEKHNIESNLAYVIMATKMAGRFECEKYPYYNLSKVPFFLYCSCCTQGILALYSLIGRYSIQKHLLVRPDKGNKSMKTRKGMKL